MNFEIDWVDVDKALPELNKRVLCCVNKHKTSYESKEIVQETHVGVWNGRIWVVGNHFIWDLGELTHWAYLPENMPIIKNK